MDISPTTERRTFNVDEKRDPELESGSISHDKRPNPDAKAHLIAHDDDEAERDRERQYAIYQKYRPFILGAVALVILGWWISATVLKATRHRWIVQTFWAWSFILLIAFRFISNSVITRPVSAVWAPFISKPFFSLSYRVRLAMGWLALLAIVFGSAFGFPLPEGTSYGDRAISVFGLFVFSTGFWLSSKHRSQVPWPTVVVGLFMQQAIALFVLKTDAGFKIFLWIARLAADFLSQAGPAAGFFFDPETTAKHWFFINVLGAIIFFIAFIQMLYYLGVMQWLIKRFAWFFFKTMNTSGAEAIVATASPWVGIGESACLVRPFMDFMTESEIHLVMTSGFSTISGSVFAAYISMGVPGQNLVTSSVMSIPASIAISKLRIPETDEPLTRGQVVIDQGVEDKRNRPANALHAFSKGALFGLIVAGQIVCNVLTVLALVYTIDGFLTWVGRGFGIHELTLNLIFGYLFYPITFLIGVPRGELLRVARLLGTKLVANEFVAYQALRDQHAANPFSPRAYTIASYGLCGFANLGSLGIQIGVLSALAPSRGKVIARVAPSAMICGFLNARRYKCKQATQPLAPFAFYHFPLVTRTEISALVSMDAHPLAVMDELERAGKQFRAALDQYLSVCSRMGNLLSSVLRNVPQTYLHHINTEIAHFPSYEPKIKQAEATVCGARNRLTQLTPGSSLPPEILGRIFHLVAKPCDIIVHKDEKYDSQTSGSGSSEVVNADIGRDSERRRNKQLENFPTHLDNLSRVCSYWRQIAINTPSLWTHVDVLPHKSLHEAFLARAEVYITRADPLPIELHVSDPYPLAYNELSFSRFLSLIHGRINSLNIVVNFRLRQFHISILDELFVNRTSASTSLTKLTTSFPSADGDADQLIDWFENDHDGFFHLTILHLHGMFPMWESMAYHNLVDLRLTSPSDERWTIIYEWEFRRILKASPGLRILHFALDIVDRPRDDELVTPVRLNDLEVVSISTHRGNEDVLLQPGYVLRMLAPGSKPLRLSIYHNPHDDNPNDYESSPEEVVKFFQRSNVAKFCAKYSCLRLDQYLCLASNLEDLALDSCVFGPQDDHLLQRGNPATSRLNSLILHHCSPSLEQLEMLLEQYPTNSLILSRCCWDYIEDSSEVRNPVRQVSDLLQRYPATGLIFQPSSPTENWDLID